MDDLKNLHYEKRTSQVVKQMTIRIPLDIYKTIAARANITRRSDNQEVLYLIEYALSITDQNDRKIVSDLLARINAE